MSLLKRAALVLTFALATILGPTSYAAAQQRLALVVGQGAYEAGQIPTAVNDAGLVAQTLTSAGFEVVQGRDLGSNDLRRIVRDFLDKAETLEPDSAVVVYLSGHGIQLEGDNYLIPVDARIQRDTDVPLEGFRLSDLIRSLADIPLQTRVVIADMAREYPVASNGRSFARGLSLVEPPPGFLIAFSSAPNVVAPDGQGPYGAYAAALVEMIRQPGLHLDELFSRVRLRTHEATKGLQTPWHAADLGNPSFIFFELTETASAEPLPRRERRRIEDVPPEEAYGITVERDTIRDYQEFLRRYPDHPLARRVTALLAARREAVVWRKTVSRNTSEAYWTYLRRYPDGPHAADCRRRLTRLAAPLAPPAMFEEVIYEDLPPPLPDIERIEVVDVTTIIREAPPPPPPPPPIYLLPARDYDDEVIETIVSRPPPPPLLPGILPIPVPIPVPIRARPPETFYQPIAPVTSRGVVAIPVAAPPVSRAPPPVAPGGQRPRFEFPPQPVQPALPEQPGLAGPIQPLPVATTPTAPVPRAAMPGARRGDAGPVPRLPSRPIPLSGPQPGQMQPGQAQAEPTTARPAVSPPQSSPGTAAPIPPTVPAADQPAPRPGTLDRAIPAPAPGSPATSPGAERQPPATTLPRPADHPSTGPVVPPPISGARSGAPTLPSDKRRQPPTPAGERRPDRDRSVDDTPPAGSRIQTLPPGTPPAGARVPGAPRLDAGGPRRSDRTPAQREPERAAPTALPGRPAQPDLVPRPPSAAAPAAPRVAPGPAERPGRAERPDRPARPPQGEARPAAPPRPARLPVLEQQVPRGERPARREERSAPQEHERLRMTPTGPRLPPSGERLAPPLVQQRPGPPTIQAPRPARPGQLTDPERPTPQPAVRARPERFERPAPMREAIPRPAPPPIAQPRAVPPPVMEPRPATPQIDRPRAVPQPALQQPSRPAVPPPAAAQRPDQRPQRCLLPNEQPCPR